LLEKLVECVFANDVSTEFLHGELAKEEPTLSSGSAADVV
jgi:hypothetical protein